MRNIQRDAKEFSHSSSGAKRHAFKLKRQATQSGCIYIYNKECGTSGKKKLIIINHTAINLYFTPNNVREICDFQ